jgi:hypothetical protein
MAPTSVNSSTSAQQNIQKQNQQQLETEFLSSVSKATSQQPYHGDGKITIVDLNSAGGLNHVANDPAGLDFNNADMNQCINDLFGNGRDPDVITMQELPVKAAMGTSKADEPDIGDLKGIKQRLEEKTGDKWDVYYNAGGSFQYYRSEPGKPDGAGTQSASGTAIFVRRGPGSDVQSSSAILPSTKAKPPVDFPAIPKEPSPPMADKNAYNYTNTIKPYEGSLSGVRLITKDGNKTLDVYNVHMTTDEQKQNQQLQSVRNEINNNSKGVPVILTGDFNMETNWRYQIREKLLKEDGFVEASGNVGHTTGNDVFGHQYDHMFTRGIYGTPVSGDIYERPTATKFNAPSSDHDGLVMTVDPKSLNSPRLV